MPRARNTRSIAVAASASSCGMTRSRLETRVTVDAHRQVGRRELGAGDTGADDDQVRRQLGQVVDLAPGEDPLAVGHRVGQQPRRGPGRDQHGGRVDLVRRAAVGRRDLDPVGVPERVRRRAGRVPVTYVTPALMSFAWMSADCASASRLTRSCTADACDRHRVEAAGVHAELLGVAIAGHHVRTGDEGLRRYAVGQHARAAGAVRLDDRHIGVELGGDQGRLVSGRARRR